MNESVWGTGRSPAVFPPRYSVEAGVPAYYREKDCLFTVIIDKSAIKGHLNFSDVLFIKSLDKR